MSFLSAAVLMLASSQIGANDNGLALTPPLGWRSWNLFNSNVNQPLMERIMTGMTDRSRPDHSGRPSSLCDLGYCDVGLDDNWQQCDSPEATQGMNYHREDGSPIVNTHRFPDLRGMVDLGHSLNLTVGWYGNNCICRDTCRDPIECDKQIEGDVRALVEFGFDSWKLDGCGGETDLPRFDKHIRRLSSQKPILVENCHWGNPGVPYYKPNRTLPPSEGCPWNFYRSSGDIGPSYASMMRNLLSVEQFRSLNLSYPGCWAYPDMMQVGVVKEGKMVLSEAETRSHFGSWCIVSSPLILSHDVNDNNVTDAVWEVISNREAISVNQAYAGDSGGVYDMSKTMVNLYDEVEDELAVAQYRYLSKPLGESKGVAVLLMNSGEGPQKLNATFRDVPGVGCPGKVDELCACQVRDIWTYHNLGRFVGTYSVVVGSHDASFLVISDCNIERKKQGGIRVAIDE